MISSFKSLSLGLIFLIMPSLVLASSKHSPVQSEEPAQSVMAGEPIQKWCSELQAEVTRLKWKLNACEDGIVWKTGGTSIDGRPLVYTEFGDPKATNVTLVLTMIHGDEITPMYIGIQLIHWLKEHEAELKNSRVVIAPLVNPDGFYKSPKTRMNAHGVDINRNFATKDWANGVKRWMTAFKKDPRRFPGSSPRSEPETLFQEELIRLAKPQKILSVHSPLNHMDYDGPTALSLSRFPREYVHECLLLQKRLKAKSTGYFPGSLGNFAGRELGIPTITLELPTANANKADEYWKKFSEGIRTMIQFSMPSVSLSLLEPAPVQVSTSK